jgi:cell division protein FtsB
MNHIPIHTNIAPNYNYLSAENAFLRQNIEYKDAVLCEQAETINKLQADVSQLSQASTTYKQERDKFEMDARRWHVMKQIIKTQGNEQQLYEVQKIVDHDIAAGGSKARLASK